MGQVATIEKDNFDNIVKAHKAIEEWQAKVIIKKAQAARQQEDQRQANIAAASSRATGQQAYSRTAYNNFADMKPKKIGHHNKTLTQWQEFHEQATDWLLVVNAESIPLALQITISETLLDTTRAKRARMCLKEKHARNFHSAALILDAVGNKRDEELHPKIVQVDRARAITGQVHSSGQTEDSFALVM